MSSFDSTKTPLSKLLEQISEGKIQLPAFQRGWMWDDSHIRSLLVSVARSFPVGSIMLLETGGPVRFQIRPVEGIQIPSNAVTEYLQQIQRHAQVQLGYAGLNTILATHLIDPTLLRADDFTAAYDARKAATLSLVERAMGKTSVTSSESVAADEDDEEKDSE